MEKLLTPNAKEIIEKRYLRGRETIAEWIERIAGAIASPIENAEAHALWVAKFAAMLNEQRFIPNTPCLMNAGTTVGQLAACFVLPIADDMGAADCGIFATLRNAALIQQSGGGIGFDWSQLRPEGDLVASSGGQASGPISFMRIYDTAFGGIAQGGCEKYDTLINTSRGLLRLDELVDTTKQGWQDTTSHETLFVPTDNGIKRVNRYFNNGTTHVLRIETNFGIEIIGTPNHKIKIMTADGPVWREFNDIHPGDYVISMLGQHQGIIQQLKPVASNHYNTKAITLPPVLTEEFAFMIGYLDGNGFMASDSHDNRIGFSVAHSSYLMTELPLILTRLFPECKIHTQQKLNDASVTFVIDSALIKRFLIENGFAKDKSYNVCVPKLIRMSPSNIVGMYLRGVFEADASPRNKSSIQLITTSSQFAREISTLLIGIGCPNRIYTNNPPNRMGHRPLWYVETRTHAGHRAWKEKIGCDPRSRFAIIQAHTCAYGSHDSYKLPYPTWWFASTLGAISNDVTKQHIMDYICGKREFTESVHRHLVHQFSEVESTIRPINHCWFNEVTSVQPVEDVLTLDLEVDDNHTYIANGLISHNSRRGANMGVLRVDHPDIEKFITCKSKEMTLTNFNISVAITNKFMQAVENDGDFELMNPHTHAVARTVKARELFAKICAGAHANGEPGVLFIDRINQDNAVPQLYTIAATNPCVTGDTLVDTDQGPQRVDTLIKTSFNAVVHGERYESRGFFLTGHREVIKMTTCDDHQLRLTPEHRVLVMRDGRRIFIAARDLVRDDQIVLNEPDQFTTIKSREPDGTEDVYDCTIGHKHVFSANGILVHNCGEIPLGPYENCCLGHINLARHVTSDGHIDAAQLRASVFEAVRFLDNIVTVNKYIPAVPKLREAALATRRIGLGITGLADLFIKLGLVYGSDESVGLAGWIAAHIRYWALCASTELSRELGPFPSLTGSIWDPSQCCATIEKLESQMKDVAIGAHVRASEADLRIDWTALARDITAHGIRNAALLTVAPTGTTSLILGVDGYGCEPIFSLSYTRTLGDGRKMKFCSNLAREVITSCIADAIVRERIISFVADHNAIPSLTDVGLAENPHAKTIAPILCEIGLLFGATALNVSPRQHLQIQAALQNWVDNSISKTINCRNETTTNEVADMYMTAWKLGLKGVALYRSGSRANEVLTTQKTESKASSQNTKATQTEKEPGPAAVAEATKVTEVKKKRPQLMRGCTHRCETSFGRVFTTVNFDETGPLEVFITLGKSGTEAQADCEAIGRLISFILRINSSVDPIERMHIVIAQLQDIGGSRTCRDASTHRIIRSVPDAVAFSIEEIMKDFAQQNADQAKESASSGGAATAASAPRSKTPTAPVPAPMRDICPTCHKMTLIHTERCARCEECNYSAC